LKEITGHSFLIVEKDKTWKIEIIDEHVDLNKIKIFLRRRNIDK